MTKHGTKQRKANEQDSDEFDALMTGLADGQDLDSLLGDMLLDSAPEARPRPIPRRKQPQQPKKARSTKK